MAYAVNKVKVSLSITVIEGAREGERAGEEERVRASLSFHLWQWEIPRNSNTFSISRPSSGTTHHLPAIKCAHNDRKSVTENKFDFIDSGASRSTRSRQWARTGEEITFRPHGWGKNEMGGVERPSNEF